MATILSSDGHFLRKLEPIEEGGKGAGDWQEVSFVVVPDVSSSRATCLSESSWAWLSPIAQDAHIQARYYEFQCNPTSRSASVWQALNDGGDSLLCLLLELDSGLESLSGVVLISCGLGGILAKKEALTRLSERYFDPAVRRLSDKLIQVILIGCPHPTIDNKEKWLLLDYVLRHDRDMDSKALKSVAEEAGIVANLCFKFQEAGVHCSIIITYESQPTKMRRKINFLKTAKRILVDKDFAETCVKNEEMVALDSDGTCGQACVSSGLN